MKIKSWRKEAGLRVGVKTRQDSDLEEREGIVQTWRKEKAEFRLGGKRKQNSGRQRTLRLGSYFKRRANYACDFN